MVRHNEYWRYLGKKTACFTPHDGIYSYQDMLAVASSSGTLAVKECGFPRSWMPPYSGLILAKGATKKNVLLRNGSLRVGNLLLLSTKPITVELGL